MDGLRGFAALAVMGFHYQDIPALTGTLKPIQDGGRAVDIFFVLSGFVLASVYEPRFTRGLTTSRFMTLRWIRLYPMYAIGTFLAVLLAVTLRERGYHAHPEPMRQFLTTILLGLLFIPRLTSTLPYYPLNFPAWSLLYEILANWFYRLAFRRLTNIVLALLVTLSYLALWFDPPGMSLGIDGFIPGMFRVGFSFFAGVLTYRIWLRSTVRPRVSPWILVAAAMVLLIGHDHAFTILAFPPLVYLAACSEPRGVTRRLFSGLGDMSYGVYTLHIPIMTLLVWGWPKLSRVSLDHFTGWNYLALMGGVMAAAYVLDLLYDRPVRAFLTRWTKKPGPALAPA
jgi:peptidoglycan/LPS O-acetylase OafA/YrhL